MKYNESTTFNSDNIDSLVPNCRYFVYLNIGWSACETLTSKELIIPKFLPRALSLCFDFTERFR